MDDVGRLRDLTFILIGRNKPAQRPVIGPLHGVRKQAGRKLLQAPMVSQALATDPLPAAGLIGAVAAFEVRVTPALIHRRFSFKQLPVNDDLSAGAGSVRLKNSQPGVKRQVTRNHIY
jgi:hypothetical protein